MDGFLLGDAPEPNHACASIEDLKLQFAGLREAKVTEFKADHVSATFEFRPDVIFSVPENENDAASPNQTLDPAMGGVAAAPPDPAVNGNGSVVTRDIRAHDTLMIQPADDPALQRAVAKHIIASLGSVDGSSWTVRSVSRNASGWTFQYLCKNSTQAWQRQTSKNAAKVLVGESSGKDGQDPVNLGKPAPISRSSIDFTVAKRISSSPCLRLPRLDHHSFCQEQSHDNGQNRAYSIPQDCGGPRGAIQATSTAGKSRAQAQGRGEQKDQEPGCCERGRGSQQKAKEEEY